MKALRIKSQTLVAQDNCCSVIAEDTNEYDIVNIYVDNIRKLLQENVISWPIEITKIGEYTAIVDDPRIPSEHYRKDYCTICCPHDLWPQHQKDKRQADIDSGALEVTNYLDSNGDLFEISRRTDGQEAGYFYIPYPIVEK